MHRDSQPFALGSGPARALSRVEALYKYCCLHPNIINYVKGMGNWELLLDIEVDSREQLRDIMPVVELSTDQVARLTAASN